MKKTVSLGGVEVTHPPFQEASVYLAERAAKRLVDGETNPIVVRLDTETGDKLEIVLTQDDIETTFVNTEITVAPLGPVEIDTNFN